MFLLQTSIAQSSLITQVLCYFYWMCYVLSCLAKFSSNKTEGTNKIPSKCIWCGSVPGQHNYHLWFFPSHVVFGQQQNLTLSVVAVAYVLPCLPNVPENHIKQWRNMCLIFFFYNELVGIFGIVWGENNIRKQEKTLHIHNKWKSII